MRPTRLRRATCSTTRMISPAHLLAGSRTLVEAALSREEGRAATRRLLASADPPLMPILC